MSVTPPAQATRSAAPTAGRGPLVLICAIANFLVMADIVAAAMCISAMPASAPHEAIAPDTLARQLGLAGWTWMATGFLIIFAALLSVGGHLAARLGPRLVLGAGLVIFASSTAAMMAAPTWLILLAARAGQAGGAALMIPASLGLITAYVPPHRQRVAIGWWSGAGAAGTVMVHAGGGALVAALGWRALFLPGLLLAAALVCLLPALPRDQTGTGRLPDLLGALLLVIGIGALVLVISQGSTWGWMSRRILAAAALGLLAVAVTLWRSRAHPRPAVPLTLWASGRWRWGWLMSLLYGVTAYPILTLAPSYLTAAGYDAWWATALLCPLSAAVMLAGPLAGAGGWRWGSAPVAYTGVMLVLAAGMALAWLLRFHPNSTMALIALAGLGLGLGVLSAITAAVGSQTPLPGQAAIAAAASMTARQGGGALGVAGASVLLQHPVLPGPSAGFQSVLAACLAAAGVCGVLAVSRPLARAYASRRARQPRASVPSRPVTLPASAPRPIAAAKHGGVHRSQTVPQNVPQASPPPVTLEVLAQLHTALLQAAQAAESWMHDLPAEPAPTASTALQAPQTLSMPSALTALGPTAATGAIARRCSCHPDLDPLAATILHSAPAATATRAPAHQRLQPVAPLPPTSR